MDDLKEFVSKIKALADNSETNVTLLISAAKENLPEGIEAELVDL